MPSSQSSNTTFPTGSIETRSPKRTALFKLTPFLLLVAAPRREIRGRVFSVCKHPLQSMPWSRSRII